MRNYVAGTVSVDQLLAFTFGVVFAIVLLVFAVAIPNPTQFSQFVFRVVLALAAAGVGAVLPGLIHVELPFVRAGGALALFVIVFFLNPPALVRDTVEDRARRSLSDAYQHINRGNFQLALSDLQKAKALKEEPPDLPFLLGIIEKRKSKYKSARNYFQETLNRINDGKNFITDRSEAGVHFELGEMKDGLSDFAGALQQYREATKLAEAESYIKAEASFETARLELQIWLANRNAKSTPYLRSAINDFELWLDRTWPTVTTKMWGNYHTACAYKEMALQLSKRGDGTPGSVENAAEKRITHEKLFLREAESLTGYRKYHFYYIVFLITAKTFGHLPGEPLPCGLDHLLNPFKIH